MSAYQRYAFGPSKDHHSRTITQLNETSNELWEVGLPSEAQDLAKIADKLDDCCRSPQIAINRDTSEIRIQEYRCKLRICSYCGRARAQQLKAKMLPLVEKMNSPRMIGFSLVSNNDNLRDQFNRLVESFAKLRRSKLWKAHFSKGFYTLEATHNRQTDQWHPHIHGIVDGDFVPQKSLVKLWREITTDSCIVFVKLCRSHRQGINYITKYITKTQDAYTVPQHRLAEWALTLRGMRFLNLFGGLKHPTINDEDEPTKMDVQILTPMNQLSAAIYDGDQEAQRIWNAILYHHARGIPKLGDPTDAKHEVDRRALITELETWLLPPPEQTPPTPTITPADKLLFDNSPPHGVY